MDLKSLEEKTWLLVFTNKIYVPSTRLIAPSTVRTQLFLILQALQ